MKTKKQKSKINNEDDKVLKNKHQNYSKSSKIHNAISNDIQHKTTCNDIKNIELKSNNANATILSTMRKKKFGKPITVSSLLNDTSPIPIPNILRINNKLITSQEESDIFNDFTSKIDENKSQMNITIGTSIIPQVNLKQKIINSSKNRISNELNESMDLDESPAVSLHNNSQEKIKSGPVPHFYSLRNKVICIMEPQCKWSFNGKLKIKVLYGGVKIYGRTVSKLNTVKPIDVYSPRGNNSIDIQAVILENSSDNLSDIWNTLKNDNIDCNVTNSLHSDINNLKTGWALIILQNLENKLTSFLELNCNYKIFPKIEDVSNYSWSDIKRAEIILQSNIHCNESITQTIDFSNVEEIINNITNKCINNDKPKVIMAGGKNVGKSTTMRYLINQMLEKSDSVIVLDLDLGQSEFTPSGCISLNIINSPIFGPNFTHLQKPYYQIYIGSLDVTRHLSNYINGIKKMIKHLNIYLMTNQLPIIVNTMGFCRDIGWKIMTSIIKYVQPTDVIQINSNHRKNNFEQLLFCETINRQVHTWSDWENSSENNDESSTNDYLFYSLHVVDSQAEIRSTTREKWNIEPHQHREIVMLAYLSQIINLEKNSTSYDDSVQMNINSIVPYQVPFTAIKLSLGYSTTPHVLSVMNGNIVALCGIDFDNKDRQLADENSQLYPEILIRIPLAATCYGYGIIRGVDMDEKQVYINTPISTTELKYVNCLIGCMPVPSGLLQLNRSGVPYTGGDCNLPTSRDPRRGYFRMKYRNST